MNSFEANKIIGAVLGTLVFVMGVGFIADEIYAPIEGHGAGYALPEPTAEGEAGVVEEASVAPIAARMQTASAEAGADLIVRCQSCHDYSSANENKVGPGLFNVVGRPIASHEGFAYSDALVALSADGAVWDYEHLDGFLEKPSDYAPGTKMTFAGLSDPQDRADLIAFLRENSDDPFPLPEAPAETAAPAEGAAVEGTAGQGEAPAEPDPLIAAMAAVTPEDGEALIVRCQACHDYSEANTNRVGPGLHGVVGRPIASHPDFSYSDALASLGAAGEIWTPQNLSAFLQKPSDFAPGTKMSFPGLADIEDRAALIVYLNSIAETPIDLGGGGAPAEDEAAPANAAATPADQPAAEEDPAAAEPAPATEATPTAEEEAPVSQDSAATQATPAAESEAAAGSDPLSVALAAATPDEGKAIIVRCQACHDYSEANANRVGPGLHGVVGRPIASHPDYAYSDALASMGTAGEVWTPENLSAFLQKPSDFAPGTKMSFPGLADIEDRAALIVYLNSIADSPIELGGSAQ